jgi:hypothetical protein
MFRRLGISNYYHPLGNNYAEICQKDVNLLLVRCSTEINQGEGSGESVLTKKQMEN